ncbi:NUDIX hydrolase [Candidatus Kaiserbacteria bacterium]|nr:MAG: NUDIX hydrolase [Candidatus Kaiserbacteria bacterium]
MNNMEIPNAYYRTSVKAIIINEKKEFLLAKEENGYWELLGGGLDFGEDPTEGLKREIFEETGLEVTSMEKTPSYFLTDKNLSGYWASNVLYITKVKNLDFTASDECTELRYFNRETLREVKAFTNVIKFAEMFNPDNHE